jgi:hypothetical protein
MRIERHTELEVYKKAFDIAIVRSNSQDTKKLVFDGYSAFCLMT